MSLAELAGQLDACVVAAWIDVRTGGVIAQHMAGADPFAGAALAVAAEVMRSRERPPRAVLLSERHVHIMQRGRDPQRALVVVCERSANLGLAVSLVRSVADAEAA